MERLLARVGSLLEWRDADKVLFVSLVMAALTGSYILIQYIFVVSPQWSPYLDRSFATVFMQACLGEFVAWLVLAAWALWTRRRARESRLLLHVHTQFWYWSFAIYAHFVGPFTTLALVGLLGGAVAGILLFGLRVQLPGIVACLLLLAGLSVASWKGVIRYAPLMKEVPFVNGHIAGSWLAGSWAVFLLVFPVSVALIGYMLTRLAQREASLKAAYEELSQTKDQLVRAESLAAIGSLVSGVAHELGNPLGSSAAILQSLVGDLEKSPTLAPGEKDDALEALNLALVGERRAHAIIGRLYRLSDDLNIQKSHMCLDNFIISLQKKYPSLRVDSEGGIGGCPIPEGVAQTILPNLIDNALAGGGTEAPCLEVRLADNGTLPPLHASGNPSVGTGAGVGRGGTVLQFTVSDSGRGIPKEQQAGVFKPFFTGQKTGTGHGVGLGLYIVHELITRMGGAVELQSTEGKGTRVTVRVPVESGP